MDIFKLIFDHDLTLEHVSSNGITDSKEMDREALLTSFLLPQQTYNRYYFTGSRLGENKFGLSSLKSYPDIVKSLNTVFSNLNDGKSELPPGTQRASAKKIWHHYEGTICTNLTETILQMKPYEMLISGQTSADSVRNKLILNEQTGIRELFKSLSILLDNDHLVLISEKANHGLDLVLYSRHNLYEDLLGTFQKLITPDFRYFSINGKRVGSERQFYFETWTLERPPHGFQEVLPDSRIR